MKSISLKNLLLYVSLIALLYFSCLIYMSYNPSKIGLTGIQFIIELFTIPMLLVVLFGLIYSLVKLIQKIDFKEFLLIFLINLIIVVFLIYITYLQTN